MKLLREKKKVAEAVDLSNLPFDGNSILLALAEFFGTRGGKFLTRPVDKTSSAVYELNMLFSYKDPGRILTGDLYVTGKAGTDGERTIVSDLVLTAPTQNENVADWQFVTKLKINLLSNKNQTDFYVKNIR